MELRAALESTDVAEIQAKTEALNEASRKLADAVYAQASAQAQEQAPGDGASSTDDGASSAEDEVIEEADYEVVDEEDKATRS